MLEILSALAKVLLYAGALSSAGLVLAAATLRPALAGLEPGIARARAAAAAVTFAACLLLLVLLFQRLGGEASAPLLAALFLSSTGLQAALIALGSAVLLASGRAWPAALLLLAGFGVNGHVPSIGPAHGLVAFLHVAAAGWWLGALVLLHRATSHLDPKALAALVARFSRAALAAIAALLLAGALMVFVLWGPAAQPWRSPYWQLLALKIAFVLAALGFAAFNRLRLTPRLAAADPAAAPLLRRTIRAEIALIALALAAMAALTTWTSPHG